MGKKRAKLAGRGCGKERRAEKGGRDKTTRQERRASFTGARAQARRKRHTRRKEAHRGAK